LVGDNIYIFGGKDSKGYTNDLLSFNITTNTWNVVQTQGNKPDASEGLRSGILYGNKLVIYGGLNRSISKFYGRVSVLDLQSNMWFEAEKNLGEAFTPGNRYRHTSATINNSLYIFGGYQENKGYMDDLHILDIDIQQIGTKSVFDEAPTTKNKPDVMISLHCGTMKNEAFDLKKQIEANKLLPWVCLEMQGGAAMRDDINWAAMNSRCFVALINESWAKSGECKWEFNIAIRCNITQGYPAVIPVIVDNLDFNKYSHVKAIMANTNAIFWDRGNSIKSIGSVIAAIGSTLKTKTEVVENKSEVVTNETILEELKKQNQVLSVLKDQIEKMIKVNTELIEKVGNVE